MTKQSYVFNFSGDRKGKIKTEECFKGQLDNTDTGTFEWLDCLGNVLGFAKDDGTPNHRDSFITKH